MNEWTSNHEYNALVERIGTLMHSARSQVAYSVNRILVDTYWSIGKYIVDFEQQGSGRAEYGSDLLNRLSKDLSFRFGKGFSRSNIIYMRRFYHTFQKGETASHVLSWSHYFEILKADDPLEISFYVKECEKGHWSVRELKRQMKSMLFHRIALSKDKDGVLKLASKGTEVQKPEDIIRDPYVLEFTGLPDIPVYKEIDLQNALENNLSKFLLELGKGFSYVGKQYRMTIDNTHYKVDLVFYNFYLKAFVLIDLKRGAVKHQDVGQMNMYLNYFRHEINSEGDNEPIGIVLGAYRDRLTIQYATENITNQLFVSRYQLYLPDRKSLESALMRLLEEDTKKQLPEG